MGVKHSKAGRDRSGGAENPTPSSAGDATAPVDEVKPVASTVPSSAKDSVSDYKPDKHDDKEGGHSKRRHDRFSESRVADFFETYMDAESGRILAEGVERFCQDLEVDPTDFAVLAWAWKCDVQESCVFTREEFFRGCERLRTDNAKSLRAALPRLVGELDDEQKFASLYKFTFGFGLDKNETKLAAEMAVDLWRLLFSRKPPSYLEDWCQFCTDYNGLRISKDTWNMFLQFTKTIRPDFCNFDEDSAWPNVMDEFVEAQRRKA